jgi:hypothetical protein
MNRDRSNQRAASWSTNRRRKRYGVPLVLGRRFARENFLEAVSESRPGGFRLFRLAGRTAARVHLKNDLCRCLARDRNGLALFRKIGVPGDQLLFSQGQIDRQRRMAQRNLSGKYLGAIGDAGNRDAAVGKVVVDGQSFARPQGDFRANIGPPLVMEKDCVSARRKIRD